MRALVIDDEWHLDVVGHPKAGYLRDGRLWRVAFIEKSRFGTGEARSARRTIAHGVAMMPRLGVSVGS